MKKPSKFILQTVSISILSLLLGLLLSIKAQATTTLPIHNDGKYYTSDLTTNGEYSINSEDITIIINDDKTISRLLCNSCTVTFQGDHTLTIYNILHTWSFVFRINIKPLQPLVESCTAVVKVCLLFVV